MGHIDDLIREAVERGEFDDLPGKGKPLNLSQDPLLDPLMSLVSRILKDNGVSHPFIEARKAMEAEAGDARAGLAGAWRAYQDSRSDTAWSEAIRVFRSRVHEINRQVRLFNLKMPSPALHRLILNADEEIERMTGSNPANDRAST